MKKYIINSLLIISVFCNGKLFAQAEMPEYKQMMNNPVEVTFSEIQQKAETYFADKDKGRGSGYKQWKRWEYKTERNLTPDGKVANATAMNWNAYKAYFDLNDTLSEDDTKSTNGFWSYLGPNNYVTGAGWNGGMGRVNCIAFHPTNSSIIYIGTPAGGLWYTNTGGGSWTCLTDGMPSIGVSGIVIHPYFPNTMYILTGDGDGEDTFSIGVMKTINGGKNWFQTGLVWDITNFKRGYKLAIHPDNTAILFAVTSDGIYKTINGGTDWDQVETGSFRDLEFNPGDASIVYASTSSNFYRSIDHGDNWTLITSGLPSNESRIAIGVSPANPSYVYLLTGPATAVGEFKGVFRSYDSGLNFDPKANEPNLLGYETDGQDAEDQASYDLAIAVSRTDVADIMIGGINTWVSDSWGNAGSWTITSWWKTTGNTIGYSHADIHALEINPLNDYLWCGSDGGIFRSTDFGNTWLDLSGSLGITQWYQIDGIESNSNLLIGGTQDNGTNKWDGTSYMEHMQGADGMDCMIDHSNSNILYATHNSASGDGRLEKSTNAGYSFSEITPTGVIGYWVTPLAMNPSISTTIYGGYSDVMKSTDGGSNWTNTGVNGGRCMAVGTSFTGRIYAISNTGGTFYRSDNAAVDWNTYFGPAADMTFCAVDPANSLNVFLTIGGYNAGSKVYESLDGGSSWSNISGSLPNIPVYCIAYDPGSADGIYIGTSLGVFYRDDNIGDWIPFMNGLPNVDVFDIEINNTNGLIRAGTYGRGLWSSSLYTPCPYGYQLTTLNDPSNPNYTGFQLYEASTYVNSTRIIMGGVGTDVTYKAGSYIDLEQGFHVHSGSKFKAINGPCDGVKSINPGIIGETLAKEDLPANTE